MVRIIQGIIDCEKDFDFIGLPKVTLEIAMVLPKADVRAAQVFLCVGEVEEGRVIMVVVIMVMIMIVVVVIHKEMV